MSLRLHIFTLTMTFTMTLLASTTDSSAELLLPLRGEIDAALSAEITSTDSQASFSLRIGGAPGNAFLVRAEDAADAADAAEAHADPRSDSPADFPGLPARTLINNELAQQKIMYSGEDNRMRLLTTSESGIIRFIFSAL